MMICSLLLSVKAKDSTQGLFLTVNPASKPLEQGSYVISFLKCHESEAMEKLSNLSAFFMHCFGIDSLKHFTQDTVNQAKQTLWNVEHDCPVMIGEQYLKEIEDSH